MIRKRTRCLLTLLLLVLVLPTAFGRDDDPGRRDQLRTRYLDLENELRQLRSQQAALRLQAANEAQMDEGNKLRQQANALEQRAQALWNGQVVILREGERLTREDAESGEAGIQERLRFLDNVLAKLRAEKSRLEGQASDVVKLEDADALRAQAAQFEERIRYVETERERWQGELGRQGS